MVKSIPNRSTGARIVAALFAAATALSTATASAMLDYPGSPVVTYAVIPDEGNVHFSNATVDLREGARVLISAELTVMGTAINDGTSNTMMIRLLAPSSIGVTDYTDDVAMDSRALLSRETQAQACRSMGRAWIRYLDLHRRTQPAAATMPETTEGMEEWEGPDVDANTICIISPRDSASGLPTGKSE